MQTASTGAKARPKAGGDEGLVTVFWVLRQGLEVQDGENLALAKREEVDSENRSVVFVSRVDYTVVDLWQTRLDGKRTLMGRDVSLGGINEEGLRRWPPEHLSPHQCTSS